MLGMLLADLSRAAHPRSTVRECELLVGLVRSGTERQQIIAVVGNRRGLTFRDWYNSAELVIAREEIGEIVRRDDGVLSALGGDGAVLAEFRILNDAGDSRADLAAAVRQ